MELDKVSSTLAEVNLGISPNAAAQAGPAIERVSLHRLGWDELTVEQKIERMREIVKGIDANSHEHWRRLEELRYQMRHHSHGNVLGPVLMPLDTKEPGYGAQAEDRMPGGKVYF